jgi:hypothetical protein
VRGTGAGLRPSTTLIWFSLITICRCNSGMPAETLDQFERGLRHRAHRRHHNASAASSTRRAAKARR